MDESNRLNPYEHERLLRIAENKRHMQAIGLDLAASELLEESRPKSQARQTKTQQSKSGTQRLDCSAHCYSSEIRSYCQDQLTRIVKSPG